MAHRYAPPALIDISSDSEEVLEEIVEDISISDNDSAEREANNRRLTQAINYLQQDGGDDSPRTFMDRVNRINETLLKHLPQQGQTFDQNLYRRARVLVMDAKRDFRDAAQRDSPMYDVDDALPQYYMPMDVKDALYRDDSSSPSPSPGPSAVRVQQREGTSTVRIPKPKALASRYRGGDSDVQRERMWKYGGPDNVPEMWYKDFPAILPFPETHMMAHWESMKIDYDLARPKGGYEVETDVPFHHPLLEPYLDPEQYESGSRFKLPIVSTEDQEIINQYATKHIKRNLDGFYKQDSANYAPSIFLEHFTMGHQCTSDLLLMQPQLNISRGIQADQT
jgi:hypothetical protein